MTTNWVDKSCSRTVWLTPPRVLERVRAFFGGAIPCDPATEADNPTRAAVWYTEEADGLRQSWGPRAFVNPPYGRAIRDWCEAIHREAKAGCRVVALLPCGARFSTRYWQDHILQPHLGAVCFVRGRVAFELPDGTRAGRNPYDSAIYGFNVCPDRFRQAFEPLGRVLAVEVMA